jgi:polyphosphate:AMP phosphotransferase
LDDSAWSARKDAIRQFERQLADDGAILLKFWLHIDQKEQKKRLKTWVRSPYEGWRVTREDWKIHKNFKEYLRIADELLVETDTPYAPWTMVAAHDKRHRRIQVLRTAVETLERTAREGVRSVTYISSVPSTLETRLPGYTSILDRVDLSKKLERPQYLHRLAECQKRLRDLEFAAYAERLPVIVVYEGWDASGKGGNIKRVTQKLDPHGYDVIPVSKPEGEEANHHYLWRFWRHLPKAGHIAIFDRSWYGRVMVERVEGFSREEAWKRAYYEINEFERRLADYGTVIVKFWLHISKEEQLQRFQDRERKPHKQYKLTDEDWRNREKWEAYALAVNEMLERTSTPHAPWTVVEGNDKLWARIKTLDTLIAAIETALQRSPR